jgi:hypothetical protein
MASFVTKNEKGRLVSAQQRALHLVYPGSVHAHTEARNHFTPAVRVIACLLRCHEEFTAIHTVRTYS